MIQEIIDFLFKKDETPPKLEGYVEFIDFVVNE